MEKINGVESDEEAIIRLCNLMLIKIPETYMEITIDQNMTGRLELKQTIELIKFLAVRMR